MNSASEKDIQLPKLALPTFQPQLKTQDEKVWIFDSLRKKYLVLTPEEWVRQHWINFLIEHQGYPKGLFSLEKGLKYNQLAKRTDLVVFDREGRPYLLVECKAPDVPITEKTLAQAMSYNKKLNCSHIILSNGYRHFSLEFNQEMQRFVQKEALPKSP